MIETDAFRAQACSTNFSLSRAYEKLKLIGWFAVPAKTRWNEEAAVKRFSVPAHYIQEVPESSECDARTLAKILDKAGGLEYRARRSHSGFLAERVSSALLMSLHFHRLTLFNGRDGITRNYKPF